MYILGVIAIKSLSFASLLCLEVILHHGFQMTYSVFVLEYAHFTYFNPI